MQSNKSSVNIENLNDEAFNALLEESRKKLEELTHKTDKPSLLEQAQKERNRELLDEYYLIAKAYYELFGTNFTSAFDSEFYQSTIFRYAIACMKSSETLEELIALGSKADETYYDENYNLISAFSIALQLRNLDAVRTLLKHCPNLAMQIIYENGSMPAHYAAQHDALDILDELYKVNPDVTHIPTGPLDMAPLHTAAMFGRAKSAAWILEHDKSTCNLANSSGYTALHFAVLNEHPEMVSLLLANGADINLTTKPNTKQPDKTPLQVAADIGSNEIARLIMKHHEKIDDKGLADYTTLINHLRTTPVDYSKLNENIRVVFGLLDYLSQGENNPQFKHALFGYNLNPKAWPKDIKQAAAKKIIRNILDKAPDPFLNLSTDEYKALKDKYGNLRKYVLPILEKYRPGSNKASPVTPSKLSP